MMLWEILATQHGYRDVQDMLYDLLIIQRKSYSDLGQMFNCNPSTVRSKALQLGLKSGHQRGGPRHICKTLVQLADETVIQILYETGSMKATASKLGISTSTLTKWLRRKGYVRGGSGKMDKGPSLGEICDRNFAD